MLVFFYGLLAVAAAGRSSFELITKYGDAPLAYVLSAVAAAIYVVAFVALLADRRVLALVAVGVELIGVIVVGTLTYTVRKDFPDTTVWSGYGSGYGYLPAVLPVLALLWLRRSRPD